MAKTLKKYNSLIELVSDNKHLQTRKLSELIVEYVNNQSNGTKKASTKKASK